MARAIKRFLLGTALRRHITERARKVLSWIEPPFP